MTLARSANAISGIIATGLNDHTDAADPHPQYVRQSNGSIRLPVFDADPAPPSAGVLLYVFDTGSAYELRIIDSLGAVTTVGP